MKICKFLIITIIVTMVSLLYVHQQFALVKLSYDMDIKEKKFNQLLDQNKILAYNVFKLKSPLNLSRYNNNFKIASSNQIISANPKLVSRRNNIILAKRSGFNVFGILTLKRQAEAQTIK